MLMIKISNIEILTIIIYFATLIILLEFLIVLIYPKYLKSLHRHKFAKLSKKTSNDRKLQKISSYTNNSLKDLVSGSEDNRADEILMYKIKFKMDIKNRLKIILYSILLNLHLIFLIIIIINDEFIAIYWRPILEFLIPFISIGIYELEYAVMLLFAIISVIVCKIFYKNTRIVYLNFNNKSAHEILNIFKKSNKVEISFISIFCGAVLNFILIIIYFILIAINQPLLINYNSYYLISPIAIFHFSLTVNIFYNYRLTYFLIKFPSFFRNNHNIIIKLNIFLIELIFVCSLVFSISFFIYFPLYLLKYYNLDSVPILNLYYYYIIIYIFIIIWIVLIYFYNSFKGIIGYYKYNLI